ncbi:hypothetical protein [Kitasatospora sp. NPDC056531]|uniref:hypothetical protein n=1 Tax=Kitasatospora sp. NPDC056531 TaxID=3345856 RepID=UPI0036AFD281
MRENTVAREAALDEAAAEREAILRQHYNRLCEPEDAHRPPTEDEPAMAETARARRLRESHRAVLAVARGHAIPMRTAQQLPRSAFARGAA